MVYIICITNTVILKCYFKAFEGKYSFICIYNIDIMCIGLAVLPNITHPAFQKLLETAKSQLGATASLGTTISGTKDTDFESLLKAADAEMYENKKQYYIMTGKDRRKHSL